MAAPESARPRQHQSRTLAERTHKTQASMVHITYYLEVISSWCYWVEPVWKELKSRYSKDVTFDWKLALMDASGLPQSKDQCDWFYRRSGTIMRSDFMLNSGWFDKNLTEYLPPNLMSEAARLLGASGDEVRIALATAALREGKQIGNWSVCAEIASKVSGFTANELLNLAQSPSTLQVAKASTERFHSLKVSQRPAFELESSIGDRAVLSGVVKLEPLVATIEAMLSDAKAYSSYKIHHGTPPTS